MKTEKEIIERINHLKTKNAYGKNQETIEQLEWVLKPNKEQIQLTEDIMPKIGFKKYQWQNAFFKKTCFGDLYVQFFQGDVIIKFVNIKVDSKGEQYFRSIGFIGNKKFIRKNKYYVHQLQNLYFALTNEKLNYKP